MPLKVLIPRLQSRATVTASLGMWSGSSIFCKGLQVILMCAELTQKASEMSSTHNILWQRFSVCGPQTGSITWELLRNPNSALDTLYYFFPRYSIVSFHNTQQDEKLYIYSCYVLCLAPSTPDGKLQEWRL